MTPASSTRNEWPPPCTSWSTSWSRIARQSERGFNRRDPPLGAREARAGCHLDDQVAVAAFDLRHLTVATATPEKDRSGNCERDPAAGDDEREAARHRYPSPDAEEGDGRLNGPRPGGRLRLLQDRHGRGGRASWSLSSSRSNGSEGANVLRTSGRLGHRGRGRLGRARGRRPGCARRSAPRTGAPRPSAIANRACR
jgi:hypothetical protein